MGVLTDKDILLQRFEGNGFFTAEQIREIIQYAPEVKPFPTHKAFLIRDIRSNRVVHVCGKCDHMLNASILPTAAKFCMNCGARFDAIMDKPGISNR